MDRINVRRLLIVIEKAMAISLRPFVFEPNDDTTRFRVEALLNSYLDDLSAQGAFQTEGGDKGFNVICDETNNTGVVIDQNELKVDVFVKPIRTAEFIQLQTIITSTGASFEELISRGVGK
jgi:phage tail sheath protein FI